MKTYRIGENIINLVCYPICIALSGLLIYLTIKSEEYFAMVLSIILTVLIIIIFVFSIIFEIRKGYALKGSIGYGIITDKERNRSGHFFYITYTDMNKNKVCIKQCIAKETYSKYNVGDKISIYINGKYAAFDEGDIDF